MKLRLFGLFAMVGGCLVVSACSLAESAVEEVVDLVDDDADQRAPSQAATELCTDMVANFDGSEEARECDHAVLEDCVEVIDSFSRPFMDAVHGCVEGGGLPMDCMERSTGELSPTQTHFDLAHAYCDDCLYGTIEQCEQIFFSDDTEHGLGSIFVPFSEEVVADIIDECTSDFICALDLLTCARGVLEDRLIPDHTALCLLEEALF